MRVEDLIMPACERCEEPAFVHQFGWGADGGFYALTQCKRCGHLDWFTLDVADIIARILQATPTEVPAKPKGMDNGYL